MKNLITLNKNETISTIQLRAVINKLRKEAGESAIQNNQFVSRVEDELGDEIEGQKLFDLAPRSKTPMAAYNLTLEQATLVGMRESKSVRRGVLRVIQDLQSKLAEKQIYGTTRQASKDEYLPMTLAIQNSREEIKPYHFSNEADLINRILLGMTAAKFRKHHEIGKGEAIRDYLTPKQLEAVISLQRANTVYLEEGLSFQKRKEKLTNLFNRKHQQKLIEEIHSLES